MDTDRAEHAFRLIDAVYLFRNEHVSDHAKRCVIRMLFIQIDNILRIVPRIKNKLPLSGATNRSNRKAIEDATVTLRESYESSYDVIRDKIGAHGQPIDLLALSSLWSSYDHTLVEILYSDVKELQSRLEQAGLKFNYIPDYAPQLIPAGSKMLPTDVPVIASDRFGFSRPNTTYLLPCHESQEKAQTILSVIDFLEIDFALSVAVDNPSTLYTAFLYDVAWMLVTVDVCSLIDNLFESTSYDNSLLEYWANDIKGHAALLALNSDRDLDLEAEIREIRNKYAAHFDSEISLSSARDLLYSDFEFMAMNGYCYKLVNGFRSACREDIRTRIFLIQNAPMPGAISVSNKGSSFGS